MELNVLPPFLGGEVAAEAVEPNTDANSFAADNNDDGAQINDFRFICINNNNNTIMEEETIPPGPPEPPTATLTVKKQVFGCATIPEPGSKQSILSACNMKTNKE